MSVRTPPREEMLKRAAVITERHRLKRQGGRRRIYLRQRGDYDQHH